MRNEAWLPSFLDPRNIPFFRPSMHFIIWRAEGLKVDDLYALIFDIYLPWWNCNISALFRLWRRIKHGWKVHLRVSNLSNVGYDVGFGWNLKNDWIEFECRVLLELKNGFEQVLFYFLVCEHNDEGILIHFPPIIFIIFW